jgi:hypothetical protein
MPKKTLGGFGDIDMNNVVNTNNLDYTREYQSFNYDKYINAIKTSNFAGGCDKKKCKKINDIIDKLYINYINKKPSTIKNIKKNMIGGTTYDDNFNIKFNDMKNVSNLEYSEPWEYADVRRLSTIPNSNFEYV